MKVSEILAVKGSKVWSVKANTTIHDAVRVLVSQKIGALLVLDDKNDIIGILTERDIMRACYEYGTALTSTLVEKVMTARVMIATPDDDLDYAMNMMTQNRIRHIPVMDKDKLQGMISIGDVVKALLRESQVQIRYLKDYLHGGQ
ncbi:MAG: hypothetical protein COV74_10620 [Candidatus Omnitrophica bacterium CG11_big_fil_rev_8_21_14_0_20_45_26]|uniref:CBS domain-containing protein n=1 Tax=Candidatus Abzuiibacterium crystallinum TaxID=1974748 RepID=A0A2H0LKW0_9BACT|nr:MAG: hypothetical protein COV74_10620 [Candidatus Omnitrophica bacterium CG11_big_fil_rev_8_21_14_0_20_45_26]PIW63880.1 MAG: hypothetical protein COW12_08190 [Candidatus Omnitrophica bacterium CG12_big_fil_rev_8_21_14_0_65_45_16]